MASSSLDLQCPGVSSAGDLHIPQYQCALSGSSAAEAADHFEPEAGNIVRALCMLRHVRHKVFHLTYCLCCLQVRRIRYPSIDEEDKEHWDVAASYEVLATLPLPIFAAMLTCAARQFVRHRLS